MIGFRIVAIAGLDSAYRWRTSMFALMPSTHLCAKTRATFDKSSMFWESLWDMTGIIVDRSRFECVSATVIATSLPITVTPTCMTASGMTGFTLPGMIEEPGWIAGRFSSRRPVWGPDPSHRKSFAILTIDAATVWIIPLASTSASWAAWASKWFSVTRNFVFVAALIF